MTLILRAVLEASPLRLPRLAGCALALLVILAGRPALPAQDIPYGQGLLWRIERPDSAPSYLFGTIHITDERVLDLPAPVREAFASARSLTVELVMTRDVGIKMGRAMILNDGRRLDAIVGPELFDAVAAAGRTYGMAPEQLRHFKPWALATIFSLPQAELARNSSGDAPLDVWLQAEAAREGKPVFALETAEEQIAVFDQMSETDQVRYLSAVVRQNAQIETIFERMVRLYLARDLGGIHALFVETSTAAEQELLEFFLLRLNDARNRIMVERMAERLREGGAFIAVGALHLPGEAGLLSLLEQRGYRLSRLY